MDELTTLIRDLDDATAERILAAIARHRIRSGAVAPLPESAELAAPLAEAAGTAPSATAVSAGELARQSLLLLADDPAQEPVLRSMIDNPPAESFDPATVLAVGAAALCILQSYIKIERTPAGKWSFKFEKQPMNHSLLKTLIEKVAGYLTGK